MRGEIMVNKNTIGATLTKVINGADKGNQGHSVASAVLGTIVMVSSLFKK